MTPLLAKLTDYLANGIKTVSVGKGCLDSKRPRDFLGHLFTILLLYRFENKYYYH